MRFYEPQWFTSSCVGLFVCVNVLLYVMHEYSQHNSHNNNIINNWTNDELARQQIPHTFYNFYFGSVCGSTANTQHSTAHTQHKFNEYLHGVLSNDVDAILSVIFSCEKEIRIKTTTNRNENSKTWRRNQITIRHHIHHQRHLIQLSILYFADLRYEYRVSVCVCDTTTEWMCMSACSRSLRLTSVKCVIDLIHATLRHNDEMHSRAFNVHSKWIFNIIFLFLCVAMMCRRGWMKSSW